MMSYNNVIYILLLLQNSFKSSKYIYTFFLYSSNMNHHLTFLFDKHLSILFFFSILVSFKYKDTSLSLPHIFVYTYYNIFNR